MKNSLALVSALSALAFAGAALAQSAVGEDSTWKFRSPSEAVILQNNLQQIELQKAGYFDKLKNGSLGALNGGAGAGGLLGAGASTTSNNYQIINQTTNNCSSSGSVGSPITCGSGSITSNGTSQTTVGSTLSTDTLVTDNTVTSHDNTSTSAGTINNATAK